jgi:peptidoglycan/xylan/chitin deacetylase (PgdA/CDA1 family)
VALTFDDGPGDLTRAYLDVLDAYDVRATFFLIGRACEREPELLDEYEKRGHQIACHGYDHARFPRLSWRALRAQLVRTDAAIGHQPTERPWVRPPHGDVDPRVFFQLLLERRVIALWSLDPRDYEVQDPLTLAARCSPSRVTPGEIILLHEHKPWTLAALPRIITALRDADYSIRTMAEMLGP